VGKSSNATALGGGVIGGVGGIGWDPELSEGQEELLQDLDNQTKASSDTMELFMQEEHFLRIWEMRNPAGPEEVENVLRRHRRRVGTGSKEKGKELGKNPEKELEVVPEADVEMTLQ